MFCPVVCSPVVNNMYSPVVLSCGVICSVLWYMLCPVVQYVLFCGICYVLWSNMFCPCGIICIQSCGIICSVMLYNMYNPVVLSCGICSVMCYCDLSFDYISV